MVHALTGALDTHGEAGWGAILHDYLPAKDHDLSGGGVDQQDEAKHPQQRRTP
jgi:hypothetical protein